MHLSLLPGGRQGLIALITLRHAALRVVPEGIADHVRREGPQTLHLDLHRGMHGSYLWLAKQLATLGVPIEYRVSSRR